MTKDDNISENRNTGWSSLSVKLLIVTLAIVLLGGLLTFPLLVANFRTAWLERHLYTGQLATLALEATTDNMVSSDLEQELLANAEVLSVVLVRNDNRQLILSHDEPAMVSHSYDLRSEGWAASMANALGILFSSGDPSIRIIGKPRYGGGEALEIVIREAPLRIAMETYSWSVIVLELFIAGIAATVLFFALHYMFVTPMQRLTENMIGFRKQPEDVDRIMAPSGRQDEIGDAEQELSLMQLDIRAALHHKSRLAALGEAVSKINHDLRNILTNAQLIGDRLGAMEDPAVKKLAPRLVASVNRAITLCTRTLRYGHAGETPPHREQVVLASLVTDAGQSVGVESDTGIIWRNTVPPDLQVSVDPDQFFRVLLNLGRNAVQALEADGKGGSITVSAAPENTGVAIRITDTGPGIPDAVRDNLFKAFTRGARRDSLGLGLSIADELVRAHGGRLELESTGANGTIFCISLPEPPKPATSS